MSTPNGTQFRTAAAASDVAPKPRRRTFTISAQDDEDAVVTAAPNGKTTLVIKKRLRGRSLRSNVLLRAPRRLSIPTLPPSLPTISGGSAARVGDGEEDSEDDNDDDYGLGFDSESDEGGGEETEIVVECYDDSGGEVVVVPYRAVVAARTEDESAADTAYWGWVVLLSTWVVFVVGMGSVMGVWEWAWGANTNVSCCPSHLRWVLLTGQKRWPRSVGGEKVFPGDFPIPGYYPALCILTCIMAWVWVVVAWVGMKYFKHAKIQS